MAKGAPVVGGTPTTPPAPTPAGADAAAPSAVTLTSAVTARNRDGASFGSPHGLRAGYIVEPQWFGKYGAQQVLNAHYDPSHAVLREGVEQAEFGGINVINLDALFQDRNQVVLGFGVPNVYTVLPNAEGNGWERFSAFMFKRQQAFVGPVKEGLVQSGFLVRFKDLPEGAVDALRAAMQTEVGNRHVSCARANSRVLTTAGFTSGGKPLEGTIRPRTLFTKIFSQGLEYQGKKVSFDIIRTTPRTMEEHFLAVEKKELTSPGRTLKKLYKEKKLDPGPRPVLTPRSRDADGMDAPVDDGAPTLLRASVPSSFGAGLRRLWGHHIVWEATPNQARASVNALLPDSLQAFPDGATDLVSRLKKKVLFSPAAVGRIREHLAQRFDDVGEYSPSALLTAVREHTDENPSIYNIVITGDRSSNVESRNKVLLTGIQGRAGKVDWVMSKHVLVSNWNDDVRFAGETWVTRVDGQPVLNLNANSGTYKPSHEQLLAAGEYVSRAMPGIPVVVHPFQGEPIVVAAKAE